MIELPANYRTPEKPPFRVLDKFPRTKHFARRIRRALVFCRAHGYDHGKRVLRMVRQF